MEANRDRTRETASIIARLKGAFFVGSSQSLPHGRAISSTTLETKWESGQRRGEEEEEEEEEGTRGGD
jgi:hypothetical protein